MLFVSVMQSYANWMSERPPMFAVFWMGFSVLIAWPFALIFGSVMFLDLLAQNGLVRMFRWCLVVATICLGVSVVVDYYYYRKFIVAVLNIFIYNSNAGSEHGQNLYGVEPWTFFFRNLFLNYSIVFLASLLAPVVAIAAYWVLPSYRFAVESFAKVCIPWYLWFLIFSCMPHKEERFMFVAYPLICLTGA